MGSTLIEHNNWGSVVRRLLLVMIAVSFAIAPAVARADNKPPKPDSSAVSQYVEMVPTARGSSEAGVGNAKGPLTAHARRELRAAPVPVANALRLVGTSSAYGAPSTRLKPAARTARSNRAPELQRAFSGAVAAAGAGSTSHVFALGAFLLVVTAVMVGAATRQQTLRRRPPA